MRNSQDDAKGGGQPIAWARRCLDIIGNGIVWRLSAHDQALDRYARGLMPNSARKVRLKLEMSPKPLPSAMSEIFVGSLRKRTAARRSLNRSKYWCGVVPVISSNIRRKWQGLNRAIRARLFKS